MWEAHNWSKGDRLWIGLFSVLPILAWVIVPITMLSDDPPTIAEMGWAMTFLLVAFPVLTLMLMLLYLPAIINNKRISGGMQTLWIVGVFTAAPLALPWYWYVHVWKAPYAPEPELPGRDAQPGGALPPHGAHAHAAK